MRSVVINEVVRLFFALPARQHKACLHRDDQSHSNRMTMNMNMTTTSTTNELFHRKRQIVSSSVLFPSTPRAASSCLGDKNEDGDIEQGQGIKMSTAPSADTASSSTNPCYQVAVGDDEYNKRGDDQNDDIKKKMKVKRALVDILRFRRRRPRLPFRHFSHQHCSRMEIIRTQTAAPPVDETAMQVLLQVQAQ